MSMPSESARSTLGLPPNSVAAFDLARVRTEFPALRLTVHGKPLVYLDNGATSQKPQAVIDAVSHYYNADNANVHRGVHQLSERATAAFEGARDKVQGFINAADRREIVFVRGTTEAINLVAQAYGRKHLNLGDEIVVTELEHHSNIVPWQILCQQTGALLRVAPITDDGDILLEDYLQLLNERTRLVAVAHISNALGTILPVRDMIEAAHQQNIPVLLDGAQAAPHQRIDVQALDCDFYAFSAHKAYGPTGIGALYGKTALLEAMDPYQGGGDMILQVTFKHTRYNRLPYKFEAGTPNIAGVVGFGAAIDYLNGIGFDAIEAQEKQILDYATRALSEIPGLRLIGVARDKTSILSFVLEGVHPHDIGTILDRQGIAIRAGHHCAMPIMQHFGLPATVRASFGLYNTLQEVDALVAGIYKVKEILGR